MSTQTEALKLALEALRMPSNYWNKTQFIKVKEAIAAAEEALAQPEQRSISEHLEPVAYPVILPWDNNPEKHPQFYTWTWDELVSGGKWRAEYGWKKPTGKKTNLQPLYTTPPQRKETEQEPVPDLYVKDINGNFHSYKEKGHTVSSQCVPPSHVGVGEDDFTPQRKPLTDAQSERLYRNIEPSRQQDARSLAAFKRLLRVIEAAHGIKE